MRKFSPHRLVCLTILWACLLVAAPSALALNCPSKLTILFPANSLPPFLYGSGSDFSDPPGLLINWIRNAIKATGCAQTELNLRRLPTARITDEALDGKGEIIGVAGAIPARLAILSFPLNGKGEPNDQLSFLNGEISLYARNNATYGWDQHRQLAPGTVVGVVRGQATAYMAKDLGWMVEEVQSDPANFGKLALGRVDLVLGQRVTTDDFLREHPEMKFTVLSPPVMQQVYYSPVTKAFHAQYPEFTQAYWLQLCRQGRAYYKVAKPCMP